MHLYSQIGEPVYQVPYADPSKGMRPSTLADARKLGLFPSVTEILNVTAKPGLERWKVDQAIMSALTLPRDKNEPDDRYLSRIRKDAQQQARTARDKGQEIHDAVEKLFTGRIPASYRETAEKIKQRIVDFFGETEGWEAEISFASPEGYGGRVDLLNRKINVLLDLKTKEEIEPGKKYAYDEHGMQLAAYREGLQMPGAFLWNVFADWNGEVVFHEWPEVQREMAMFRAAFNLWKLVKKFDPAGKSIDNDK